MYEIARKDFPLLPTEEFTIVIYGGMYIKGLVGIEFNPCDFRIPKSYRKIGQLEPTQG